MRREEADAAGAMMRACREDAAGSPTVGVASRASVVRRGGVQLAVRAEPGARHLVRMPSPLERVPCGRVRAPWQLVRAISPFVRAISPFVRAPFRVRGGGSRHVGDPP
jgi:hypothetical protein